MEHILIITLSMLGFEIILGLWLGWMYGNLYEDWKEFVKQKRIFTGTVREWHRLQKAIKIEIEVKKTRKIVDIQ